MKSLHIWLKEKLDIWSAEVNLKKVIAFALLLLLFVLGGCSYVVPSIPTTPSIEPSPIEQPTVEPTEPASPVPTKLPDVQPMDSQALSSGSLFFTPTTEDLDFVVLAPAYFEFGTVSSTSTIDTWTEDGYLQVSKYTVSHQQGDPLYFIIFNDSYNSFMFEIKYEDAVDEINWCEATQRAYYKAPFGVEQTVAIADTSIELQAGEAITIPISIVLTEDIEYPEYWEFRLSVLRRNFSGTQEVGGKIRVFVSMR